MPEIRRCSGEEWRSRGKSRRRGNEEEQNDKKGILLHWLAKMQKQINGIWMLQILIDAEIDKINHIISTKTKTCKHQQLKLVEIILIKMDSLGSFGPIPWGGTHKVVHH